MSLTVTCKNQYLFLCDIKTSFNINVLFIIGFHLIHNKLKLAKLFVDYDKIFMSQCRIQNKSIFGFCALTDSFCHKAESFLINADNLKFRYDCIRNYVKMLI